MNKKCFQKIFGLVVLLCLTSTCHGIARWVACAPSVMFGALPGNQMQPVPIPETCLQACNSTFNRPYAITTRFGEDSFSCFCPNAGVLPPTDEAQIMTDFRICNLSCTGGEFLQRCGSLEPNRWMWYEESTRNESAGSIAINMCYNITTQSALTQCREERTLSAIFMGRSQNGHYRSIAFSNPCGINNGGCDNLANCSFDSSSGFRTCTCRSGYTADISNDAVPGTHCMDLDECAMASTNDCNQTSAYCVNSVGGFSCRCRVGFIDQDPLNPGRSCTPVFDECRMRIPSLCTSIATCTNNAPPPGHTCACPAGYTGDGLVNGTGCTDINECTQGGANCGGNANCVNTIGSFLCVCQDGFILDNSATPTCVRPYSTVMCGATNPTWDRVVAYTFNCGVAVLFPCNDTSLGQDRVRIVQNNTGPYESCVNHQLVSSFSSSQFQPSDFINSQGLSLIQPTTTCTATSLAVTFFKAPVVSAGFDLTNLFIGGEKDFAVVQDAFGNTSECMGQEWVENGLKFRFEIAANSTICGVTRTTMNGEIVYTGIIRGLVGDAPGVVSRARHFYLSFSCAYQINDQVSNDQPVFFYDLGRRKRAAEVREEFDFPGAPDLALTMSLRKGGNSGKVQELPLLRKVGERVDIEASLTGISDQRYGVKVLRCWESLEKAGVGYPFKNIISNSCDKSEMDNHIYLDQSNNQYNYKFAFDVQSIYGGTEDVYVSCLFDVLSPGQTCRPLVATDETLHIDPYMLVRTVGPIRVHDVCGGKNRGGCQHFCSETNDNQPLCHCAKGFVIDHNDPTRCLLPGRKSEESSFNLWYYVVPAAVLIAIILLLIIVIQMRKYYSKRKGMYDLKRDEVEPDNLIDSTS